MKLNAPAVGAYSLSLGDPKNWSAQQAELNFDLGPEGGSLGNFSSLDISYGGYLFGFNNFNGITFISPAPFDPFNPTNPNNFQQFSTPYSQSTTGDYVADGGSPGSGGGGAMASTPEPTLTLGLITLGGLMLGTRKKVKA